MKLEQLQAEFSLDVASLIIEAKALGYFVTLGEAYRTPEQAAWNAAHGTGVANSLHTERLAIDINLFTSDWHLITDGTGHEQLGAWWKALDPRHKWGGDFQRKDFNHYSMSPDGVRG